MHIQDKLVQSLVSAYGSYPIHSRTKHMLRCASLTTIEYMVGNEIIDETQVNAIIAHSKLPTGKVAMVATARAFSFIATRDISDIEPITAGVIAVCALSPANSDVQFESLRFAMSGKGNNESKHINNVSGAALRATHGAISNMSTVCAKTSRTVGKNGSMGVMGLTRKTGAHTFAVNADAVKNPFLLAYADSLAFFDLDRLVKHLKGEKE